MIGVARIIGRSVERRPIRAWEFGGAGFGRNGMQERRDRSGLILGALHGDEPKSVFVCERLAEALAGAEDLRLAFPVVLVPVVNPDGLARRSRRNARQVDLNRNFPTRDWSPGRPRSRNYGGPRPLSEPESRTVQRLVERLRPTWIVTVHSISGGRFCNNYDGPGEFLARRFAAFNGYPVTPSIGYPTPGSFGTWAGGEGGIPVLTLELPSNHSPQRCWRENEAAFRNLLGRQTRRSPTATSAGNERPPAERSRS